MYLSDSVKVKPIIFIVGMLVLCLAAVACAGPPGAPGAPGSSGSQVAAKIDLASNALDVKKDTLVVYGSGFTPETLIDIRLLGEWEIGEATVTNPKLDVARSNEWGAFKTAVPAKGISGWGIEVGSICVVKAIERDSGISVTVPFEAIKKE